MSTHPVTLKPISEVAEYLKNLIPASIPERYALKPMFESVASEESIRSGIAAFRDFFYLLFDRLISDGHLYAKPPKTPSGMTDYPFLHNMTNLLVDIGYYGSPDKGGDILVITEIPLCTASTDENGKKKSPRIPASGLMECLRFLTLCGFVFPGADLDAKSITVSETQPLNVSYPNNPILLEGLKALSIADMELRAGRRYWNDNNLLRCDYRLLKAGDTDVLDELKDLLFPLPERVQEFAVKLHQRYTDMGLTCVVIIRDGVSFSYSSVGKGQKVLSPQDMYQQRLWAFTYSIRHGYSLFVRSRKTGKYAGVIETFPQSLQEKIATGYGCYRKLGRERCQGDCQGIRIPLDDTILDIGGSIETWLDCEMPGSLGK